MHSGLCACYRNVEDGQKSKQDARIIFWKFPQSSKWGHPVTGAREMKIGPDCVPCILKMCLGFIRKTSLGDSEVNTLFNDVLQMPSLRGRNWDVTSAAVVEEVMRKTYDV